MKILVIDDDIFKREQITDFLEVENIEYETFEYANPALRYIVMNKDEISGIVLDLGLQDFKNTPNTYSLYKGLDIIHEMYRKSIHIPILINSSTDVGIIDDKYPFVYGQRTKIDNYKILEDYINFLRQNEKQ